MSRVNQQTLCGLQSLWAIFLKVSVEGNIRKGENLRCGWWGSLKSKGLLKKQELDARGERAKKTLWGCQEVKDFFVSCQQWGTNMAEMTIISQRWHLRATPRTPSMPEEPAGLSHCPLGQRTLVQSVLTGGVSGAALPLNLFRFGSYGLKVTSPLRFLQNTESVVYEGFPTQTTSHFSWSSGWHWVKHCL